MAGIISNVTGDIQRLRELKAAIEDVKKSLKGIDIRVNIDIKESVEAQLKALSEQYTALVMKIAEAEGKIKLSVHNINKASDAIIQAQEKTLKVTGVATQQPSAAVTPSNTSAETVNIQAQAKAYEDLRTEINAVLGTREANIKRMLDEKKVIDLINAEINKITKSQGEYNNLSSSQQKRLEQLNNSLLTHKTALAEVRQVLSNNAKMDNAAATSMNELSQSLSRMRIVYRELTEEERKSPFGKELISSIQQADTKIKELDASIGNHARNVGNYKKEWNGLQYQMQMVARELPNFAINPQIGIMSLTNNLPYLADELKKAKDAHKAYIAEVKAGNKDLKAVPSVTKQIISSLFSWQTGLIMAITLITAYRKEITEWVGGLFNAKDAMKPLVDVQQQLNEVQLKGTQNAQLEIAKLNLLYKATQDASKSIQEKKKAVDELQKLYPDYFKNMNDEAILAGKAAGKYNELSSAIVASARARAAQDKMVENAKKILENEAKITDEYAKREKSQAVLEKEQKLLSDLSNTGEAQEFQVGIVNIAQDKVDAYDKSIANLRREIYETNKAQIELADNINVSDLLFNPSETTKQENKAQKEAEKLRKQNDKLKELSSKQSIEQSRAEEDLQNQVDQSRISSMKEGSEKILAQMELDHEKELQVIDRQMEDLLLKKKSDAKSSFEANPANQGKSFDDSNVILSDSELKQFDSLYKALLGKQSTDTDVFYKSVTDKYQDYTTQRLAIEKQFNADIAILQEERKRAQESGDTGKVETTDRAIAQATTDKGKSLMGLDYDKLKESPEYVRAFENLKETSSETLNSLLSQLENAKQTAAQVLSPDQLREYTTTIREIMDELDNRNPFQALADRKKELAEAEEELAKAKEQLDAVNNGAKIVTGVKNTKYNNKTGKIESEKTYLSATKALEKYNKAKDKAVKADTKVKKAEKDVASVVGDLCNSIKDVGSAVGGQAGEIISLIGDIGNFAMVAMNGVQTASQTASTAIQMVEKASVILAIISTAIQIATKIASMFKGESEEEKRKKYIEQLNIIIDIYDKIIDKQKESIKFGYGFAAIEAAKNAMEGLEQKTNQYRLIAERTGELDKKFKNDNLSYSYLERFKEMLNDVKPLEFGYMSSEDFGIDTSDLSRLTGKQLEYIRDNYKDIWSALKQEQRDALQAIIDAEKEAKEIVDAWQESITGISYDSFYNEFIDTLSDMDSSAADMAENFGDYLRKSILAAMVAKEFQKDIDNLYQMWVDAGDEKSDEGTDITEDEARKIQEKQKELTEAMIKKREEMEKTYGWDTPSSQDSTKGGFEAMSQDTGTELNGRFTALQIAGEEIKNQNIIQSQSLNLLTMKADSIFAVNTEVKNIADEIRTIQINSYLELQEIRENTGAIVKPIQQMQKDIEAIKDNTKNM